MSITIFFNGKAMSIEQDYADLHNLKEGYQIKSRDEFLRILQGHALHNISVVNLLIDAKKRVN